jgi:hypothetical protein
MNIFFTIVCIIVFIIFFTWKVDNTLERGDFSILRFTSISLLSGVLGILSLMYNIRFLRAMILSISPLLFTLFPLILYSQNKTCNLGYEIILHVPHLILIILLIVDRSPIHHIDFLLSILFWSIYVAFIYFVCGIEMYHNVSFTQIFLLILSSGIVIWFIAFKIEKNNRFFYK